MTATMNNVMSELETLSTSEKGMIAKYLIASLDEKHDEDSTQAWATLAKTDIKIYNQVKPKLFHGKV